jgi:hypothetical protein
MTCETTTDFERACTRMEALAYERPEFEDHFRKWLDRGDDVMIFSNHDLGSIGSRMLGMAYPIPRDEPTPERLWDGAWGPGWRYLPDLRLTVEA